MTRTYDYLTILLQTPPQSLDKGVDDRPHLLRGEGEELLVPLDQLIRDRTVLL